MKNKKNVFGICIKIFLLPFASVLRLLLIQDELHALILRAEKVTLSMEKMKNELTCVVRETQKKKT
jgi:hypothetical protein